MRNITLSDTPYDMACPNLFIIEFIKENGTSYAEETDDYHREPLAADVITGAMGGAERCLVPRFMKSIPLSMKQIYF